MYICKFDIIYLKNQKNLMFKLSQKKYIPLSKVEVQSYIDDKFLTRHIHLESESNEKCFVVAFKTLPSDSSGVAHILEHTVLSCFSTSKKDLLVFQALSAFF